MQLIVTDLETTGVDPAQGAEIIELGFVVVRDNGPNEFQRGDSAFAVVTEQSFLFSPQRPVPPEASAIHHLIAEDLVNGAPMAETFQAFWAWPGYSVAHNAAFEQSFIDPHRNRQWLCTLKAAKRMWPNLQSHTNQSIRYARGMATLPHLGWNRDALNGAHRALPDARVTAGLIVDMLAQQDVLELLRWTIEPMYLPHVPFGKHRGSLWSDVPTDYLEWMLRQGDMNPDFHHWARVEIARRGPL